jgi:hypothetical protein
MADEELRRRLRETVDGFGAPAPGWRRRVMAALPDRDRQPQRRRNWVVSASTTAVAVALVAALVVTLQSVKQSSQPAGTPPPESSKPTAPVGGGPGPRSNPLMAYDADRRVVMLARQFLGDLDWAWDGHAWNRQPAVAGPQPQSTGQMAYDPGLHQGVLFLVGSGPSPDGKKVFSTETWIWEGGGWKLRQPNSGPSARASFSLAFDPSTESVLLFGGNDYNGGRILNDTWLWDGKTWVQQRPAVSPSPRIGAALGSAAGKLVLFGGLANSSATQFDDTWTWDGKTWTPEHPATNPPARQFASLAETPLRSAVLYGGLNARGFLSDTWVWDGKNWAPSNQKGPVPPARYNAAMTFDPAVSKTVLFGGQTVAGGALDDLWLFDGRIWNKPAP